MHIFLSGLPQVGKSTIIQGVLRDLKITPKGFITLAEKKYNDGCSGVYIHPADTETLVEKETNKVGLRLGQRGIIKYPQVFETVGLSILNQVAPPLIIMDELGFMENEALNFQEKVLEILDGQIPVFGVVKPKEKETPFLKKVKNHPRSQIVDVHIYNRNEVFQDLKLYWQKKCKA